MSSRLLRYIFVDWFFQQVETRFAHYDQIAMCGIIGGKVIEATSLPSGDLLWFDRQPEQRTRLSGFEIAGISVTGPRCLITGPVDPETGSPADCAMTRIEALALIKWTPIARNEAMRNRNLEMFRLTWEKLRELNVSAVIVDFSGEGDSGQVNAVDPVFDRASETGSDQRTQKMEAAFRAAMVSPSGAASVTLENLISELSDEVLSQPMVPDWYNNDGGNGTLEWRANEDGTNSLTVTVNQTVVDYDTTVLTFDEWGDEVSDIHKGQLR
jgi:hypothetical protein